MTLRMDDIEMERNHRGFGQRKLFRVALDDRHGDKSDEAHLRMGIPLQKLSKRCAAVAVMSFFFGCEFSESFADSRKIK